MNVLMISTLFPDPSQRVVRHVSYRPGGAERVVDELSRALHAEGHEITVLTSGVGARGTNEHRDGLHIVRRGTLLGLHSANVSPSLMLGVAPDGDFDIAHLHLTTTPAALGAASLAKRHKLPLVVTHHGGDAYVPSGDRVRDAALWYHTNRVVPRVLRLASKIIVPSAGYVEESPALAPFRGKVEVVPNGIHLAAEASPREPLASRALRVLFLGALVERKGPHVLVEAAKIAAARGIDIHVQFIGAGPFAIGAQQLERCVIEPRGYVTEAQKWDALRWADIVVLPSVIPQTEVFPISILEALAAEAAVVTSDLPSLRSIVEPLGVGSVVPRGNAEALAHELARFARDPGALAGAWKAAARARMRFDWRGIAQQTAKVYQEVSA